MKSDFPAQLPTKPRACRTCSIILSQSSFRSKGCPNCTTIPKESISISSKFKGLIGLVDPQNSWISKWQRLDTNKRGLYAMTVEGNVDEETICEFEKSGKMFYDRNESFKLE